MIGIVLYTLLNYVYPLPNNMLDTQKSLTDTSSNKKQETAFMKIQQFPICMFIYIFCCALMLLILCKIMEKKINAV